MSEQKQQGLSIGTGIIVAGVLIAGAILFTGSTGGSGDRNQNNAAAGSNNSIITNITADDHIYGDPDAPITVIEYSDYECPFCSRFHITMEEIVKTNPEVKWVYRHFPISSHRNAYPASLASECIANLGNNDLFWDFSKEVLSGGNDLGVDFYTKFAVENGIDESSFVSCFEDEVYASKVDDDILVGQLSGASGTPFSVIVSSNGGSTPFSGALPIETVQTLVDKIKVK